MRKKRIYIEAQIERVYDATISSLSRPLELSYVLVISPGFPVAMLDHDERSCMRTGMVRARVCVRVFVDLRIRRSTSSYAFIFRAIRRSTVERY